MKRVPVLLVLMVILPAMAFAQLSAGPVVFLKSPVLVGQSVDVFLDAGVAVDVSIVTLSLGMGPNFTSNFGEGTAMQAGLNTKAGVDLQLGLLTVGASYIMALDITDDSFSIERSSGLLGLHVLFQL